MDKAQVFHAAETGMLEVLRRAIIDDRSLLTVDPDGEGLLHHAGTPEVAEFLVGQGCKVDEVAGGYTPLMCASMEGRTDVVNWLLNHGADVGYVRRGYSDTALHNAHSNARAPDHGCRDVRGHSCARQGGLNVPSSCFRCAVISSCESVWGDGDLRVVAETRSRRCRSE